MSSRPSQGPAELGKALFSCCHTELHDAALTVLKRKYAESEHSADLLALDLGCTPRHARRLVQAYGLEKPGKPKRDDSLDKIPSGYAPHPLRAGCECRWCAWRREMRRSS